MSKHTWTLLTSSREPFIDVLKGVSIIFVILTHCLPNLNGIGFPFWGSQAVPVFLIIQSWHCFRRSEAKIDIKKLSRKILLPFIVVEVVIFVLSGIAGLLSGTIYETVKNFIRSGGGGPGSYYVYICVQFALLLPLLSRLLERIGERWFFVVLLLGSVLCELLCCLLDCPFYIYRLAAFRYLFLIWFGYDWVRNGLKVTWFRALSSLISVVAIYMFQYRGLVLTPWFFDYWQQCHWICYFYSGWLFIWVLRWIYSHCGEAVISFMAFIGKNSYWIYLNQLFVFTMIWHFYPSMSVWLRCILGISLSIFPVLLWQRRKSQNGFVK